MGIAKWEYPMTFPLSDQYISGQVYHYLQEKTQIADELDLKIRIEECLKFLCLIHHSQGEIPVSPEIDEIWHLLILETREYFDLCSRLPAKNYIHHRSKVMDPYPSEDLNKVKARSLSWLVSYFANFGEFNESTIPFWRPASDLLIHLQKSQGTLADLNRLLEFLTTTGKSESLVKNVSSG